MVARLRWIRSPDNMAGEVEANIAGLRNEMTNGMSNLEEESEAWMKSNAPWKDRTGEARAQLQSDYMRGGDRYSLVFSHGASYGRFLEGGTKRMRKYPIILPAMFRFAPKIRAVMNKAGRAAVGG